MEKIWLKHYPKNVPQEINPDQYDSIGDLIDQCCKKYASIPSYHCMGTEISYQTLDEYSQAFAAFLQQECGLKKGDRIALQMPNLLQFPIALFGAIRAGLTVVNTNPLYTEREMKHQFNDSGAKAIVIVANFADKLQSIIRDTQIEKVIVTEIGDLFPFPKKLLVNTVLKYVKKMVPAYSLPGAISFNDALERGKSLSLMPVKTERSDIAFLQYTGGTTGVAKGAMLTHRNILSNMDQIQAWMKPKLVHADSGEQEIVVTALPLYHIFSLTVNCLGFLKLGGKNLLITNPRDIPGFIKTLKKEKFTVVTGVNTLFNALMNNEDFLSIDFSSCKLSVAGGMALQSSVAQRWMKMTNSVIVEGYGLTESSPVLSCNPIDGTDRVGTIGIPLPNTELGLFNDDGKEVAPGESGEIWGKGPQVMKGYWQRPEETSKVITPDGWLKTGDVAVYDQDGFFKIVDRKKDMILVSGFNVYPNEIEDVVATHPKVLEVAAVGSPDENCGEVVKIFVVKKDESLTQEELIAHCRKSLTGYKIPKFVEFRKELPKTNIGKILRRELRDEELKKKT